MNLQINYKRNWIEFSIIFKYKKSKRDLSSGVKPWGQATVKPPNDLFSL